MTIDLRNYHLCPSILDHALEKKGQEEHEDNISRQKEELKYKILCFKADQAKAKNPSINAKEWKNMDDLKAYLRPLKDDNTENWPKNREGMNQFYMTCWGRGRNNLVLEESVMIQWEEWLRVERNREQEEIEKRSKLQGGKNNKSN